MKNLRFFISYPRYEKFKEDSWYGERKVYRIEAPTGFDFRKTNPNSDWVMPSCLKVSILGFGIGILWGLAKEEMEFYRNEEKH